MATKETYNCQVSALHEDEVQRARTYSLPVDEVEQLSRLFKVLGDPTRTRILRALRSGELCVCDISHVLNMSVSSVSHQLRVLRQHDLVRFRREGKIVFYSLADPHVLALHETALEHVRE
ncbi:MAG: metalloregulator ArsR/SmtB family transcription factor [Candidatus Thermoplasmatota archaeon]|nr:metalloregulator ArsR/SmtB family transcription factor [Candidatus Thermoplasmatota archaeon]